MSNSNGLNITNVNNKNLRENQQQLANDLSKQTTNKSTLSGNYIKKFIKHHTQTMWTAKGGGNSGNVYFM